ARASLKSFAQACSFNGSRNWLYLSSDHPWVAQMSGMSLEDSRTFMSASYVSVEGTRSIFTPALSFSYASVIFCSTFSDGSVEPKLVCISSFTASPPAPAPVSPEHPVRAIATVAMMAREGAVCLAVIDLILSVLTVSGHLQALPSITCGQCGISRFVIRYPRRSLGYRGSRSRSE